jgi:hypothetical protein
LAFECGRPILDAGWTGRMFISCWYNQAAGLHFANGLIVFGRLGNCVRLFLLEVVK